MGLPSLPPGNARRRLAVWQGMEPDVSWPGPLFAGPVLFLRDDRRAGAARMGRGRGCRRDRLAGVSDRRPSLSSVRLTTDRMIDAGLARREDFPRLPRLVGKATNQRRSRG